MGLVASTVAFTSTESYMLSINSNLLFVITVLAIVFLHNNEKILKTKLSGVEKAFLGIFIAFCFIGCFAGIIMSSMAISTWNLLGGSLKEDD